MEAANVEAVNEIRQVVRRINRAWTGGQPDDLAGLLHPDVVFATPDFTHRARGRAACVQSYRDFLGRAKLHHFESDDASVDVAGETAVAVCPYTVVYEAEGRGWRGSGSDVLVFARVDGRWLVTWRAVLAGPEQEVPLGDSARNAPVDGEDR